MRQEMLLCCWNQFYASLDESYVAGRICVTGNALMLLESILCEFRPICATGNALMQLESILCKFGRICATGNVPLLLETNLCEF